jgi:NADPH-dependent curcumin reductase CurA
VVRELGFDACIDYKGGSVKERPEGALPARAWTSTSTTSAATSWTTVLTRINRGARIVICGAISQYNNTTAVQGPKNYLSLLVNRARMEGMVVFDYADRYGEAVAEMAAYLKDGRMKSKEDVVAAAWPPSRPRC